MGKYYNLYSDGKKNLKGISDKLQEYLLKLDELHQEFPNDENLMKLIDNQKEIIDKINHDIINISKNAKKKAQFLDNKMFNNDKRGNVKNNY